MTIYPSLDEVLTAHARLLALFGGAQGIRDHGALQAALARPLSGYYRDVIEEAAALLDLNNGGQRLYLRAAQMENCDFKCLW